MKLKLNEQGFAEVKDGKPIYLDDQGAEVLADFPAAMAKITALNTESKNHRLAAEEATGKLKVFEGLDPEAAKKALQFAQSMEGKKVMDDEGIKTLIANAVKPLQEQLAERDKTIGDKDGHIYRLEVGNRFATSPYLKEKTVLIPEIAEAYFAKNFKIDSGKVLAFDAAGNQIFSRSKPGEPADFDEAISILVESHPQRDHILRGTGHTGTGSRSTTETGGKDGKTMTRADFDKLSPTERMNFSKEGGKLTE